MPSRSSPPRPRLAWSQPAAILGLALLLALSTLAAPPAEPGRAAGPAADAAADGSGEELGVRTMAGAVDLDGPAPDAGRRQPPVRLITADDAPDGVSDGQPPAAGPAGAPTAGEPLELPPLQFMTVRAADETVPLAYVDVSPPLANGRTALLLHDRGAGDERWAATITALADAGFRVLAPDLVGYGRSGRPAAPLAVEAHAAHVTLLLDSLGVPDAVVAAEGAGAAVAARLARRESRVRRVALVAHERPGAAVAADLAALAVPLLVVRAAPRPAALGDAVLDFLGR
jgi:hypothetical protein